MVVYPGGQCRGETPTEEIETTGAGGKPAQSEFRLKEDYKGCPFYRDAEMPFPTRDTSLSLGVLQPHDCPKGPQRYPKDYQSSLMTEDLPGAQPVLAHPTMGGGTQVPWKLLQKPPLAEVPRSRAKTHYPEVQLGRPRDLSLTTSDINGCQPERTGGNSEGRPRLDKPVDPLNPSYKMLGSTAEPPPSARASGRCTLDVSDIEGTSAKSKPISSRSHYKVDSLRLEDDFKSRRHASALAELGARSLGLVPQATEETSSPRRACLTPRIEGPQRSARSTNPLDPRYRVPLSRDLPGTSVCCTWAEEQRYMGAHIALESAEIGHIPGSVPNKTKGDKDEVYFTLATHDVFGAQSQRKIGSMPYSMYGPYGNRREWSASLDNTDIKNAQADTLARYPKVSSLNSARGPPGSDEMSMSARGRVLKACPEKV